MNTDAYAVRVYFTVRTYAKDRSYAHEITLDCDHEPKVRRVWRDLKTLDVGAVRGLLYAAGLRPNDEHLLGADRGLDLICIEEAYRYHALHEDLEIGGTLRVWLRPRSDPGFVASSVLTYAQWVAAVRATNVSPTAPRSLDAAWLFEAVTRPPLIRSLPLKSEVNSSDITNAKALAEDIVRELFQHETR
jgi:hypothetical protein